MEIIRLLFCIVFSVASVLLLLFGLYTIFTYNADMALSITMLVGAYLCKTIVKVIIRGDSSE